MSDHPLIAARKQAGLSQQGLADLIGKDRLTVLRIENAQSKPPLETVAKIIAALREKHVELSADAFLPDLDDTARASVEGHEAAA